MPVSLVHQLNTRSLYSSHHLFNFNVTYSIIHWYCSKFSSKFALSDGILEGGSKH